MEAFTDASVWFVVNSRSGDGSAPGAAAREARRLRMAGIPSRIFLTSSPAHAHRVATQAVASKARAVIACGGDGTVHSLIAALRGTTTPLGIIPSGSGDDIASCLGFGAAGPPLAEALTLPPVRIDLGHVACTSGETGFFLGVLSCGFDSAVNERANRLPRLAGQRYHVAMVQELAAFRPIEYELTVNDQVHHVEGMLIAVGNGDRYGGGMLVCPTARIDDGLLTVTVLHAMSRHVFVRLFPRVYKGTHIDHPSVSVFTGSTISVAADGPLAYADGERIGPLPMTATVDTGGLTVVGGR